MKKLAAFLFTFLGLITFSFAATFSAQDFQFIILAARRFQKTWKMTQENRSETMTKTQRLRMPIDISMTVLSVILMG